MAKAEYAVVDGTTHKIKKEYAVIGNQTRKIKKKYAVIDGKTRLFWTGAEFKLVASPYPNPLYTTHPVLFSDDGESWKESKTDTTYQFTNIINVDGVLFGIYDIIDGSKYYWYIYKSEDGGVTWAQIATQQGARAKYILRYLDNKLFVIGSHHSSSGYKNYWYSSDFGSTWTSGKYAINEDFGINGSEVLDLRYGVVNGDSTPRYYLLISENNNTTRVYKSRGSNFSLYPFEYVTYANLLCTAGALSIRDGILSAIVGTGSSTICFKYTNGSKTEVKRITSSALGTVASNSNYMVATTGESSFKFDGTTYTEGGSIGTQCYQYQDGSITYASSFVNGTRVFSFKATDYHNSNPECGCVMYSDNYGESWTIISAPLLKGFCKAMCSTTDSYY